MPMCDWSSDVCSSDLRSSQPRNQTGVSCIAGGFFTNRTTREALELALKLLYSVTFLMKPGSKTLLLSILKSFIVTGMQNLLTFLLYLVSSANVSFICKCKFLGIITVSYQLQMGAFRDAPGGSDSKESACSVGDPGSVPGSLKLTSIELVMPSSHLILCRPLLLLPPIPPSIRVFSNESDRKSVV